MTKVFFLEQTLTSARRSLSIHVAADQGCMNTRKVLTTFLVFSRHSRTDSLCRMGRANSPESSACRNFLIPPASILPSIEKIRVDSVTRLPPRLSLSPHQGARCGVVRSVHGKVLHISDRDVFSNERPKFGFHYGFLAMSGDGGHTYTHFHVDICTGEVTDPASRTQ